MCNSAPSLLYYIYIPCLVILLMLGFFVFINNRKNVSNRLFFLLTISLCLWVLFTMLDWQTDNPNLSEIYIKLSIIGTVVPLIFLYFSYVFPDGKNLSAKKALLVFIPFLPFILLASTRLNVEYIDTSTQECDPVLGKLYYVIPIYFALYIFWSMYALFKKYKEGDEQRKKQIKLILNGFIFFIIWALIMNVILPIVGFDSMSFFEPLGILVFVILVAQAIVKYQFLNIKLIATQALVIGLVILIGSQFFFIQSNINKILTGITLLLSIGFGWMLVRSIKVEVERKNELQEMSNKLATANDQLRKLDNAKSEFISIASHQLRTPLTAIKGFISLILEGSYGQISAEIKNVLNKVYLSNERLIELVEDLLNLSRIESGRMEYKFEKIDLVEICQEVYDTFVLRAKEKNLRLEFRLPDEKISEVSTDRNKIREVISNLVDNALKYTIKGGVKIKIVNLGAAVQVAVTDTGIGVPAEEVPYLFSKFSRGKDVNRLNAGGTGLGLHVGKKMMEALNGRIWVESEGANMGSTFFIEVPVEHVEEG